LVATKQLANLNAQVTEILALRILSGEYQPGEVLPNEKDLHEALGVSRTTLREAVKNLSSKGLVLVGPSLGTRVRAMADWNLLDPDTMRWRLQLGVSPKLVADMYELRECFEPAASQFAAERGTDADHQVIWAAYEEMAASSEAGGERSVEADVAFHRAILVCSRNELLSAFANIVASTLQASFQIARQRQNLSPADLVQHEAIAKAIVARNGPAARKATERMLANSKAVQMEAAAGLVSTRRSSAQKRSRKPAATSP
jgi:DNA-binding FadR family transcriptional regulator